jgi:non-ribosomal peptide synthetase component F
MENEPNSVDSRDATRIEAHGLRMSDKYPGLTDSQEPLVDELLQLARDGEQWAEHAGTNAAAGAQHTTLPIADFHAFCRLVALLARGWADREQQAGQDLLARAIAAWERAHGRPRKRTAVALASASLETTAAVAGTSRKGGRNATASPDERVLIIAYVERTKRAIAERSGQSVWKITDTQAIAEIERHFGGSFHEQQKRVRKARKFVSLYRSQLGVQIRPRKPHLAEQNSS